MYNFINNVRTKYSYPIYKYSENDTMGVSKEFIIEQVNSGNFDVVFVSKSNEQFGDCLPDLNDLNSSCYDLTLQESFKRDMSDYGLNGDFFTINTGVKLYLSSDLSVELKNRSSTYNKDGTILSNLVGEIDSSYRGSLFVQVVPLKQLFTSVLNKSKLGNSEFFINNVDGTNRLNHWQLKIHPNLTHINTYNPRPLKVLGIVCDDIYTNWDNLVPSNRGTGGFGSTDKK